MPLGLNFAIPWFSRCPCSTLKTVQHVRIFFTSGNSLEDIPKLELLWLFLSVAPCQWLSYLLIIRIKFYVFIWQAHLHAPHSPFMRNSGDVVRESSRRKSPGSVILPPYHPNIRACQGQNLRFLKFRILTSWVVTTYQEERLYDLHSCIPHLLNFHNCQAALHRWSTPSAGRWLAVTQIVR